MFIVSHSLTAFVCGLMLSLGLIPYGHGYVTVPLSICKLGSLSYVP